MITETEEIARAIDAAARKWPEAAGNRSELLRRLVLEAGASVQSDADERVERRRAAIRSLAGSRPGVWRPDEAQRLREEWPS